jgi:hypothetical protein
MTKIATEIYDAGYNYTGMTSNYNKYNFCNRHIYEYIHIYTYVHIYMHI